MYFDRFALVSLVSMSMLIMAPVAIAATSTGTISAPYFPVAEGLLWTYSGSLNDKKVATLTAKMGTVSQADGIETTTIATTTAMTDSSGHVHSSSRTVKYELTAAEVRSIYSSSDIETLQKLPLNVGISWLYKGGYATVEAADIATPFGTFAGTRKVTSKTKTGATESMWFAEGVGLIRYEVSIPHGNHSVLELTAFSKPAQ